MLKAIIILVPGLPGWGITDDYWESANESILLPGNLILYSVNPSPIGSHHDRACEIFAQLKGTQVDYGYKHSIENEHLRYGSKEYENNALIINWSSSNPIHLLCHSSGINTARVLQKLLADDFWGLKTSEDWILSITSVNGSLNGCAISGIIENEVLQFRNPKYVCKHCLGEPNFKICIHQKAGKAANILLRTIVWAIKSKLKMPLEKAKMILTWPLQHWNNNNIFEEEFNPSKTTINDIAHALKAQVFAGPLTGEDNIIFEHTYAGFQKLENYLCGLQKNECCISDSAKFIYPKTYYLCLFSCATDASNLRVPSEISPLLWPFSAVLLDQTDKKPESKGMKNAIEKLKILCPSCDPNRDNDGLVSIIDQCIPNFAESYVESFPHDLELLPEHSLPIKSGVWYFDNIYRWIHHVPEKSNSKFHVENFDTEADKKCTDIWDHFDACWARTFLKTPKEQTNIDLQRLLYRHIFAYISSVQNNFEKLNYV